MIDVPTHAITETTHTFTWTDGTRLELREPARDRTRRLWAEALAYAGPDALLNHKRLDLMDQAACDRFAAGCMALDGAIAWGPRLTYAAYHLTAYLDQQESATQTPGTPRDVWQRAINAVDFVQQDEDEHQSLTADLVYPGCITIISAPRGTGKTVVALSLAVAEVTGGRFRGERLQPVRVLYVDRDNSPQLIRNRLRRIGVDGAQNLRLLTRKDAPPLTDRDQWMALPWQDYDVVIIDSVGAATEGVSEKEGKETQHFLATLKDLAQHGLAIVALDNTIKAGTNYRGRGEKADAVDILYEARDITNWTPKHDDWWEHLPEAGDHAWASRASRHRNKTHMRLAFVASKFRLGMDPEPFALEIDFGGDCWTLRDVTEELAQAGAETRDIDHKAKEDLFRQATTALVTAISQRSQGTPMTKTEAERLLMDQGLRRQEARNLLEAHNGHHWRLAVWVSQRGRPTIVVPRSPEEENPDGGEKDHPQEPRRNPEDAQMRFPPMAPQANGGKHPPADKHDSMPSETSIFADGQESTRRKSALSITSHDRGENAGGMSAAPEMLSSEHSDERPLPEGGEISVSGPCLTHGAQVPMLRQRLRGDEVEETPDLYRHWLTPPPPLWSHGDRWMCLACDQAGALLPVWCCTCMQQSEVMKGGRTCCGADVVAPVSTAEGQPQEGGKNDRARSPHPHTPSETSISADSQSRDGGHPAAGHPQHSSGSTEAISANGLSSGRRESSCSITSNEAGESTGGISAAAHSFSQERRGGPGAPCRIPGCPGTLRRDKQAVYCPVCRGRWDAAMPPAARHGHPLTPGGHHS